MTEKRGTNNNGPLPKKGPPGHGSDASAMDAIIAMITVTTVHLLSLVFYSIQRNNNER